MYCLKSFATIIVAAALSAMALSCTKDDVTPAPKIDVSLKAEISSQDFSKITVKFTYGSDVKTIKYGFGSAFTKIQDSIKFANGTMSDTQLIDAISGKFNVKPQEGEAIVVYLRPIAKDGTKGDVICLNAAASPVGYEINKSSLGSFVFSVKEEQTEYVGLSILAMIATAPKEYGMSAEEIIDLYAMYGMLDVIAPGESKMVEMNGEPNVDHIAGVVYWNADYTYTIKTFNFTTGDVIPNAPEASIEVNISNITSETADINFTPSAQTYGYFYKLFTKEGYDAAREEGKKVGEDPDEHVRAAVAAGGSMNYRNYTDKRTMLAASTQYVLACYPYNVNGSQGWGPSQIITFTTAAN